MESGRGGGYNYGVERGYGRGGYGGQGGAYSQGDSGGYSEASYHHSGSHYAAGYDQQYDVRLPLVYTAPRRRRRRVTDRVIRSTMATEHTEATATRAMSMLTAATATTAMMATVLAVVAMADTTAVTVAATMVDITTAPAAIDAEATLAMAVITTVRRHRGTIHPMDHPPVAIFRSCRATGFASRAKTTTLPGAANVDAAAHRARIGRRLSTSAHLVRVVATRSHD